MKPAIAGEQAKSHAQERKAVRFTGKQMMQKSTGQAGSAIGRKKSTCLWSGTEDRQVYQESGKKEKNRKAGQEQAGLEPGRQEESTGKTCITTENNPALSESKSEAFMQQIGKGAAGVACRKRR